ncbi:[weak similarity to] replication protein, partial [methanotrophic bacterial endosymbiont of Bathymodiolus sp.]
EVAKYSAKDSDYLINQDIFKVFYNALKGKRLIVFFGTFQRSNDEIQKMVTLITTRKRIKRHMFIRSCTIGAAKSIWKLRDAY